MPSRLLLFFSDVRSVQRGNGKGFSVAFAARGWDVFACFIHSLRMIEGEVFCEALPVDDGLLDGSRVPSSQTIQLGKTDLAWVLARPHHSVAKEIFALLHVASESCRFVNSPSSLVLLDTKISVAKLVPKPYQPNGIVVSSFAVANTYLAATEGDCVGKPASGEAGASVFVLKAKDSNTPVLVQALTGDDAVKENLYPISVFGYRGRYAVFQEFIAATDEKRVILAGGRLITAIAKQRHSNDHRGRTTQAVATSPVELTESEVAICEAVSLRLLASNILFAGIDLLANRVLEVNIVNPGGLSQLLRTEQDSLYLASAMAIESQVQMHPGM